MVHWGGLICLQFKKINHWIDFFEVLIFNCWSTQRSQQNYSELNHCSCQVQNWNYSSSFNSVKYSDILILQEFLDIQDADDARYYTNGKDLDGSRLIVEFARRVSIEYFFLSLQFVKMYPRFVCFQMATIIGFDSVQLHVKKTFDFHFLSFL